MKRRHPQIAISDEEQIGRYAYLLGNIPTSVADKAYAAGFARLSTAEREEVLTQMIPAMPVAPQEVPDDPESFGMLMRDLHARLAIMNIPAAPTIAAAFATSPPIVAYFTAGVGSVDIDRQPLWVQDLAGHETAPIDGGGMHHRQGVNSGVWY